MHGAESGVCAGGCGQAGGDPGGCSFEQLRWTCVVRDYRNGMPADQLRQKMGLSMITWRETLPKIQKLARPAL